MVNLLAVSVQQILRRLVLKLGLKPRESSKHIQKFQNNYIQGVWFIATNPLPVAIWIKIGFYRYGVLSKS